MRRLLLASTFFASFAITAAQAGILDIAVFDNGTLIGNAPVSTNGIASFIDTGVLDPNFQQISVTANGPPVLPGGDLTSITADISASSTFTGSHTIDLEIYQTGIMVSGGVDSTFSVNNLVGNPGPTTESTFVGGTSSTLGTQVSTFTFPVGTVTESQGPFLSSVGANVADAQQYLITFTAPSQSATDTIQFTAASVVPEPSTWALLGLGFAFLGFLGRVTTKTPRSLVA